MYACKEEKTTYLIRDKYTGPCIVFIYPAGYTQKRKDNWECNFLYRSEKDYDKRNSRT